MGHSRRGIIVRSAATLVLLAVAVFSQEYPPTLGQMSEVRVIVTDAVGAVIPHAEITFKGEITKGEVAVTKRTGKDGAAGVKLPYGRCDVTITRLGFKITKVVGLVVDSPMPDMLNVTLQVPEDSGDTSPSPNVGVPTITSDLPIRWASLPGIAIPPGWIVRKRLP